MQKNKQNGFLGGHFFLANKDLYKLIPLVEPPESQEPAPWNASDDY